MGLDPTNFSFETEVYAINSQVLKTAQTPQISSKLNFKVKERSF